MRYYWYDKWCLIDDDRGLHYQMYLYMYIFIFFNIYIYIAGLLFSDSLTSIVTVPWQMVLNTSCEHDFAAHPQFHWFTWWFSRSFFLNYLVSMTLVACTPSFRWVDVRQFCRNGRTVTCCDTWQNMSRRCLGCSSRQFYGWKVSHNSK